MNGIGGIISFTIMNTILLVGNLHTEVYDENLMKDYIKNSNFENLENFRSKKLN